MACDMCGGKYRRSQMRKMWNGIWACPHDFEERNVQEFVRGRIDQIAVPVARPWGPPLFLVDPVTDIADIGNPPTTLDDGIV